MRDRSEVLAKFDKSHLIICDTTFRDGEQAAGIVFANLEKMRIAKLLDEIGVQQIEAGIPAMGGDEKAAVKNIAHLGLDASILGWNRANTADIAHSIDCDVDSVAISMSSSDIHIEHKLMKTREWVLEKLVESVEYAKAHGLYISANAEDASRADPEFIITFAKAAKEAGADRFRYCDTLGILEPRRTYDEIKDHREAKIDMEMHTHNDFGMATANALAGRAGRGQVRLHHGPGHRRAHRQHPAGGDRHGRQAHAEDGREFRDRPVPGGLGVRGPGGRAGDPGWKPIVGSNCFAHEAGIHTDGVIKYFSNYEPYTPEEVGLCRKIIIGKHSGRHTLKQILSNKGIEVSDEMAGDILAQVRANSIALKRSLSENELIYIYQDFLSGHNQMKS